MSRRKIVPVNRPQEEHLLEVEAIDDTVLKTPNTAHVSGLLVVPHHREEQPSTVVRLHERPEGAQVHSLLQQRVHVQAVEHAGDHGVEAVSEPAAAGPGWLSALSSGLHAVAQVPGRAAESLLHPERVNRRFLARASLSVQAPKLDE